MEWAISLSAKIFVFPAGTSASSNRCITHATHNSHSLRAVITSRYEIQVDQFHLGWGSHLHSDSKRDIWKNRKADLITGAASDVDCLDGLNEM
jgi:penicillin V acylase-like amidase (Ntn superfamily)